MIRFSREEDYSIAFLTYLAKCSNGRKASLAEVARKYNISVSYLRSIASTLVDAEIVGHDKNSGRYFLLKNTKRFTIGDLVSIFSKKAASACCSKSICDKREFCDTVNEWRRIDDNVFRQIASLSVNDFALYQQR
jgi:Rrf2 family protein